jgi:hypothetical protein
MDYVQGTVTGKGSPVFMETHTGLNILELIKINISSVAWTTGAQFPTVEKLTTAKNLNNDNNDINI